MTPMGIEQERGASTEPVTTLDTDDLIDPEMAQVLGQKTPAERLEIGFGLWRHADRLLRAHLRSEEPDWSEDELNREVARRLSHGSW